MTEPEEPNASDAARTPRRDPLTEEVFAQLAESLRGLKYGVVSIIVQDGVVVQIERTEKRRLRRPENS